MNHGLTERNVNTLYRILDRYEDVTEVYLFGSRAKGNFKSGSDIDLVVMDSQVSDRTMSGLRTDFEDSDLPYFVDLLLFSKISTEALREQIANTGVRFYGSDRRKSRN